MSKAKFDYLMDKASDKDTFKAVMFACKMIRRGSLPGNAIRTASRYYDCDMQEVAMLVGQRGGRTKSENVEQVKRKKAKVLGQIEAREIITECIRKHDGKPFFISKEEKRLAEETGLPERWFRNAREQMRTDGIIDWETIKDEDGHIIGTWFRFL